MKKLAKKFKAGRNRPVDLVGQPASHLLDTSKRCGSSDTNKILENILDDAEQKRIGAGRPKGSLNKEVQGFLDLLQAEKFDPAMALIRVAQGDAEWLGVPDVEMQFRLRAMETLISYVLPKRKAIEIKAEVNNRSSVLMVPAPMTAVEWEKMVQEQMKIAEQTTIHVEAEKPDGQ